MCLSYQERISIVYCTCNYHKKFNAIVFLSIAFHEFVHVSNHIHIISQQQGSSSNRAFKLAVPSEVTCSKGYIQHAKKGQNNAEQMKTH